MKLGPTIAMPTVLLRMEAQRGEKVAPGHREGSRGVAGLGDCRAGFLTLGAVDIWAGSFFLGVGSKGTVWCIVGYLAALVSTH